MPEVAKLNFEKRNKPVSFLVFHCFALPTKKMLDLFEKTSTSVHYIIQRNGKILSLIDEDKVAPHAGLSVWNGRKNINAESIGIELQNSQMGLQKYTAAQIKSLIELSKAIIKRHNIKARNIVGHSDISPIRKPDPGNFFPWEELSENGIGIWPQCKKNKKKEILDAPEIKKLLEEIGYDTTDLIAALYAFTTRFLPEKIAFQEDIIFREAQVFAYWRGISPDEFASKLSGAPKIYPFEAKYLCQDSEVSARLTQVAAAYSEK